MAVAVVGIHATGIVIRLVAGGSVVTALKKYPVGWWRTIANNVTGKQ